MNLHENELNSDIARFEIRMHVRAARRVASFTAASAIVLGIIVGGCGASNGQPSILAPKNACDGHLMCSDDTCCPEAPFDSQSWICGSLAFEGCAVGRCCYEDHEGPPSNAFGRRAHHFTRSVPLVSR